MAGEDGFYLMHRGWQDHPVFRNEEFSRRDAFVWLIEEAAYQDRRVAMPSGEVTLRRGQIGHSIRFMAKAWKWEESRVRRFLQSLAKAKIIDAATAAGQSVVTVCNYDKYQAAPGFTAAPNAAAAPQDRRGSTANENKGNQGNQIVVDDAGASEDAAWDAVTLADHLTRIAGIRHVEPGRIAANVKSVREWMDAGADPPLIATIVQSARDRASNGIHSLHYFDARIRQAIARRDHPNERPDNDAAEIRDPLLRRYVANGGTLAS